MAVEALTLVANPGSASRKYALFAGHKCRGDLHFELEAGRVVCSYNKQPVDTRVTHLDGALECVADIFREKGALGDDEKIAQIGLRVVAPSSYFLTDRLLNDEVVARLQALLPRAPLHIQATLHEFKLVSQAFANVPIVGVSDSAFHITKPDYAWNYGLPLVDADRLELKRFGYHGLSVEGVAETLKHLGKLPPKVVIAHLGSGASVTALHGGKSLDTTMGYSPLEGLIMGTRVGSIDPVAVRVLRDELGMTDRQTEEYLNNNSGLLGLGDSADIRELLRRESDGDHIASLALNTYSYAVTKAIGQMTAAMGGADVLVFTGTVGERSAPIRQRIAERLHFLDFIIDDQTNKQCTKPENLTVVSRLAHSKPIFVVPAYEAGVISARVALLMD